MEEQTKNTIYDFNAIEKKWQEYWYKNRTYNVSIDPKKIKFYALDTWAYPSGGGVHIGYVKSYCGMDIVARYKRMCGFNVLYPTGWDTLGLPAENYAIKSGIHPRKITLESIANFKRQYQGFGLSYDWDREIDTADPSYYKWTQWLFLLMRKRGLAYRKEALLNWCPKDQTVLANEQVLEDGTCERCGTPVIKREMLQWFFKVSNYAERLRVDAEKMDWADKYLSTHKNWVDPNHLKDWCVSRQRFWGPPIPIIHCEQCGEVPVPEKDLPVKLPETVDFTPTGESPLARDQSFIKTTCPKCGGQAQREADTLDTFVSSAWYQFRFEDPFNDWVFASPESINYWRNVDHYQGTIEHLTAHLVYARFVTKVLHDAGYLPFDEPFPKYTPVGLLVAKDGKKISKRLGNAPDTTQLLDDYGGDLLRLSCQFITPFDDVSRWGVEDLVGVRRFRDQVWRVFIEKVDGGTYEMPQKLVKSLHQLIRVTEENIEVMKYNVALSKIMVFVDEVTKYEGKVDKNFWETFIKILAPFVPFMAEEVWSQLGHKDSIHLSSWPKFDESLIKEDSVTIAVQINGKSSGVVKVSPDADEKVVENAARTLPKVKIITRKINNTIFVQGKVINFVTS